MNRAEEGMSSGKKPRNCLGELNSLITKRPLETVCTLDQKQEFKVDIRWVVPNFSQKPVAVQIKSPKFPSGCDLFDWSLRLLPKTNNDKVAVFLCFTPNSQSGDSPIEVTKPSVKSLCLMPIGEFSVANTWESTDLALTDLRLTDTIASSKVANCCQLTRCTSTARYKLQHFSIKGSFNAVASVSSGIVAEGSLNKRFQHLFNQEMPFADMQIHSGGAIFPAPKVVLAAGSPVGGEKREEDQRQLSRLTTWSHQLSRRGFIYTDRVEKMDQLAKALFVAADKYLISVSHRFAQEYDPSDDDEYTKIAPHETNFNWFVHDSVLVFFFSSIH